MRTWSQVFVKWFIHWYIWPFTPRIYKNKEMNRKLLTLCWMFTDSDKSYDAIRNDEIVNKTFSFSESLPLGNTLNLRNKVVGFWLGKFFPVRTQLFTLMIWQAVSSLSRRSWHCICSGYPEHCHDSVTAQNLSGTWWGDWILLRANGTYGGSSGIWTIPAHTARTAASLGTWMHLLWTWCLWLLHLIHFSYHISGFRLDSGIR